MQRITNDGSMVAVCSDSLLAPAESAESSPSRPARPAVQSSCRRNRLSNIAGFVSSGDAAGQACLAIVVHLVWQGQVLPQPGLGTGSFISRPRSSFSRPRSGRSWWSHARNATGPGNNRPGCGWTAAKRFSRGAIPARPSCPGKPAESLLVQAVEQTHEDLKMPPKGKLKDTEIAALRRWVELGAPWGDPAGGRAAAARAAPMHPGHWAFTPLKRVALPAVEDPAWLRTPVDAFVLARLEKAGHDALAPGRPADLDPPGHARPAGHPADRRGNRGVRDRPAPRCVRRVIDRLLASPLYGQRWGRHWLDVARYADTKGYVFTEERKYPFAYTYRDYVIRAFNADLPFDRFVLQQIAADQLDLGADPGPLAAMGFLTVGRRFLNDKNEIIDDRIDLVGRGLLGLTIGCARCHDHKFDPIPSEDYYSLYGVFASSVEPDELPRLDRPGDKPDPEAESHKAELANARKKRDDFLATRRNEIEKDLRERFSLYLKAAYDLELNPRNPKLDERAAADKLVAQRLRTAISLWKRRLDSADAPRDPVLGPLRSLRRAAEGELRRQGRRTGPRPLLGRGGQGQGISPLVAQLFRDQPPAQAWPRWSRGTSSF